VTIREDAPEGASFTVGSVVRAGEVGPPEGLVCGGLGGGWLPGRFSSSHPLAGGRGAVGVGDGPVAADDRLAVGLLPHPETTPDVL
jgi:hypothetical protein